VICDDLDLAIDYQSAYGKPVKLHCVLSGLFVVSFYLGILAYVAQAGGGLNRLKLA